MLKSNTYCCSVPSGHGGDGTTVMIICISYLINGVKARVGCFIDYANCYCLEKYSKSVDRSTR